MLVVGATPQFPVLLGDCLRQRRALFGPLFEIGAAKLRQRDSLELGPIAQLRGLVGDRLHALGAED